MSLSKRVVKPRSASYTPEEDQLLCHVYLDVSQDPIVGKDQPANQFWSRVQRDYEKDLPQHIKVRERPWRSLQKQYEVITAAVGHLCGAIRQVELTNPSGASELDVINNAKCLLLQNPLYKGGFKFDHVWPLSKVTEKYADVNVDETTFPNSNSTAFSGFSIEMNNEIQGEAHFTNTNCSSGRKKEKAKQKQNEEMKQIYNSIREDNHDMKKMLQDSQMMYQKSYELQLLRAQ